MFQSGRDQKPSEPLPSLVDRGVEAVAQGLELRAAVEFKPCSLQPPHGPGHAPERVLDPLVSNDRHPVRDRAERAVYVGERGFPFQGRVSSAHECRGQGDADRHDRTRSGAECPEPSDQLRQVLAEGDRRGNASMLPMSPTKIIGRGPVGECSDQSRNRARVERPKERRLGDAIGAEPVDADTLESCQKLVRVAHIDASSSTALARFCSRLARPLRWV